MHVLRDTHVVLFVSVHSVQTSAVHGSDVVGVAVTLNQLASDVVLRVGSETPFQDLHTESVLYNGGVESVTHTYSLFLSVLAGSSLVPIPGNEVVIDSVETVKSSHDHNPHTERAVGVDGVFLEVPVHFVGNWVGADVLLEP